jgi:hypothetical protein
MPSLRQVFENPKTTTRDAGLLAERANCTKKSAQTFLRSLASRQLTTVRKKPPDDAYSPTGDVAGTWLADTIYLRDYSGVNKHRGAIFTLMEVNTRFAYCRALVMDAGGANRGVSSAKTAAAMTSILGVEPAIKFVRADGGPEHAGSFAALLKKRGIPLDQGEAGTHERLGRLDRFHLSLRMLIGDHFAKTNTHVWYPVLDDLVTNYNTRPHRTLTTIFGKPTSPTDAKQNEEKIREYDLSRVETLRKNTVDLAPGTMVRLLVDRTNAGAANLKAKKANDQTWTSGVYAVEGMVGPNAAMVATTGKDPKVWPLHSLKVAVLQSVASSDVESHVKRKVNRRVVSAKRMESLNINGVEQAEALAGQKVSDPRPTRAKNKPAKLRV